MTTYTVKQKIEESLALLATQKIANAGGKISFNDYDLAMKDELYFPPINWVVSRKSDQDKMCIFKACELGFVSQGNGFYQLTKLGESKTL